MPVSTVYHTEYKYTITGLIEELERIRDEHGELPVCYADEHYEVVPIRSLYVDKNWDMELQYLLEEVVVIT